MSKFKLLALIIFIIFSSLNAQTEEKLFGEVTFISSQYAYIKFKSTDLISTDDTLFSISDGKAAAIVKFKSSTSVASQKIKSLNVGDTLFALVEIKGNDKISIDSIQRSDSTGISQKVETYKLERQVVNLKTYSLRMSLQSYGDLNDFDKTNRYRYSFNYRKEEFFAKELNFESYFILNYNKKRFTAKNDFKEILKIYALSIDYQISEKQKLILGRSLNPYIYAIGSLDGIQYLYKTGKNAFGFIAGSRPDYTNYWFQPKLFQAGIFYNRTDSIASRAMDNTIGFVEQTNNFRTDRRYFYIQHRNDLIPLTNFFISSEIDFFLVNKGIISRKINLSSFFSLLTIRPLRILSLNFSYDSRRNVYYLESFKNSIDTLIENELRQGFKVSAIFRPFSILFINLQYSRREIRNDLRPASNIGSTFGFNNLPFIRANVSLSYYNYLTSFIEGKNYSIYFTKNLFNDLLLTGNFRLYQFMNIQSKRLLIDRFVELGIFTNLFRNLSISLNFEQKLNYPKSSYLMIDFTNRF